MPKSDTVQVREAILHEMIDGEVMAINMQTGNYYNLRNAAADIWVLLASGTSMEEIVRSIINDYGVDRDTASVDVRSFLLHLEEEGLIEANDAALEKTVHHQSTSSLKHYEPPQLEVFTDVQDLLTIDPIHDVDEMGWPKRKR